MGCVLCAEQLEYGHASQIESCIYGGYHVYKDIWNLLFIDEELNCVHKTLNPIDVFIMPFIGKSQIFLEHHLHCTSTKI